MPASRSRFLNIVVWTIAGIVLLATAAVLFVQLTYRDYVQKNLPVWIDTATDSLYDVSLTDFSVDFFQGNIRIVALSVWPDSAQRVLHADVFRTPGQVMQLSFPSAEIKGVQWSTLLFQRRIACRSIVVDDLYLTRVKLDSVSQTPPMRSDPGEQTVFFSTAYVALHRPVVYMISEAQDSLKIHTGNGSLSITDFALQHSARRDSSAITYHLSTLAVDSVWMREPQGIYELRTGEIIYTSVTEVLELNDIRMNLAISREEFYRKMGEQIEIYTFDFPSVEIARPNINRLLSGQGFLAETVHLREPHLEVLKNRTLPPPTKSKIGGFPHQMLRKVPIDIHVPEIQITNGKIRYGEISPLTQKTGYVEFHAVNGSITHATNLPSEIAKDSVCLADLESSFFGAPLHAIFSLALDDPDGGFEVKATQGRFDGRTMNPMLRAWALLELDSFDVHRVELHIKGHEWQAWSVVTLQYDNLRVTALEQDAKEIRRKDMVSFLMKSLFINPSNPEPGKEIITSYGTARRDPFKSFFHLVVKAMLAGVVKTTIRDAADDAVVDKILYGSQKKDQEQRSARDEKKNDDEEKSKGRKDREKKNTEKNTE